MSVQALDHVNILTDDLDATVRFYETALGLTRGETPGAAMGYKGAWMCEPGGKAIVHLGLKQPGADYGPDNIPGEVTGAIHHVAFRSSGFEAAKARLDAAGYDYRANSYEHIGLCQIMVFDPNRVQVEMNFPDG